MSRTVQGCWMQDKLARDRRLAPAPQAARRVGMPGVAISSVPRRHLAWLTKPIWRGWPGPGIHGTLEGQLALTASFSCSFRLRKVKSATTAGVFQESIPPSSAVLSTSRILWFRLCFTNTRPVTCQNPKVRGCGSWPHLQPWVWE